MLASSLDPPDLYLLDSWDYSSEPPHPARCVFNSSSSSFPKFGVKSGFLTLRFCSFVYFCSRIGV
jgi:hypothetical protein